ncbi:flavin reductase family protein [Francisella sp. XLW-1]|uniref:flavin reductase family protein n=1 Tax=Francisella sp. XLW-1 TaxID=2610887 RepID=UPI00123DDCFF|nr:flavin reductase family protein [Francisella sp. XLW-1]
MYYDVENLPRGFMKASFVPRPIAWVSSVDKNGVANLAPFSYYAPVCDSPYMIMFAISNEHIEGGHKDTLKNILETKNFVINVPSYSFREQVNKTSESVSRDIDEFELAGLEKGISEIYKIPFVKNIPMYIECELHDTYQLPGKKEGWTNMMVIAYVKGLHVNDNVITDNKIDISKVKPISRLGYHDYAFIEDNIFSIERS